LSLSGTYSAFAETLTINGTGGGNGAIRNTSGNKTITGAITLGTSAAIQSDANTLTLSNATAITTASGKDLTIAGSGNTTISGKVTGAGNVIKSGSGTLTLSSTTNDYSGSTSVSSGTLTVGVSEVLPNATAVTVSSGATLNVALAETIGSLTGGGAVTMTAGLTTGGNNTSTTFSGATSANAGRLTKAGSGTFTLTGSNLHTGGVTISGGVLEVSADSKLGGTPVSATPAWLTLDGGTLSATTGFSLNTNRGVSLGSSNGTIQVASDQTLTYGGIVAGSGTLTKTGAGVLMLSGVNSYTGATTISAGTISIGADSGLGNAASLVTNQLRLNGGTLATTATLTLATNRGISLGDSDGTINVASDTTLTYGGVIAGDTANSTFTKAGSGTLTLAGTSTYTGSTTISAGTLKFSSSSAGALSSSTAVTVSSGATFDTNGRTATVGSIAGAGTITLGSGTLTAGGDNTSTTFTGAINGSGGLTKAGSGTLTVEADVAFTGVLTINSGGTLRLGTGGSTGSVASTSIVNNGTLNINRSVLYSYSGVISGDGGVTISGSGGLSLTGNNTFTGAVTVDSGSNLTIDRSSCGSDAAKTIAFGNIVNNATITFDITPASGTLTCTYPSIMSGTGEIVKIGTGTLVLTGANTFTGDVTVNGGTLRVSTENELISNSSDVIVGASGTFDVNGLTETVASVSGSGAITLGSGTLIAGSAGDTSYSGVMSGTNGNFTKQGSGTLTMSGD
ncbi:MAG: beta strand repeat-containing protein, partial [Actinomycetota bacterium]